MLELQFYVFSAILLLFGVTQITTLAVSKGPCPPNITSIGKFDMKQYLGKWYTYATYPMLNKKISRCKSIEYLEVNSTYGIKIKEISRRTHTLKIKQLKIIDVDTTVGKLTIATDNKLMQNGMEQYILDTDYDNFAIQYMCFDTYSIFSFQSCVINTRKRLPSAETVHAVHKIAQHSGINMDVMIKASQDACPHDA